MRRRFATKVVAPLSAKAFEFETFEAGKNGRQGSVACEQSIWRRTRRMLSQPRAFTFHGHARYAAAFALDCR